MADNVIQLRQPRPHRPTGRTCICGATWRPGFSSDPAWLITANPELRTFTGVLTCQCCGRWKLDVIREQAERKRAEQAPVIPVRVRERKPMSVPASSGPTLPGSAGPTCAFDGGDNTPAPGASFGSNAARRVGPLEPGTVGPTEIGRDKPTTVTELRPRN